MLQDEAPGSALFATAKAHSNGDVPTSKDFMAIGEQMFPFSKGGVGLDTGVTHFRGTHKLGFVSGGTSPLTCVRNPPTTFGDVPQVTSCPSQNHDARTKRAGIVVSRRWHYPIRALRCLRFLLPPYLLAREANRSRFVRRLSRLLEIQPLPAVRLPRAGCSAGFI